MYLYHKSTRNLYIVRDGCKPSKQPSDFYHTYLEICFIIKSLKTKYHQKFAQKKMCMDLLQAGHFDKTRRGHSRQIEILSFVLHLKNNVQLL